MRPLPRCSPGGPAWWERAADTGLVTPRRRGPRSRDREGTWSEVGLSRGRRARGGQQGPGRPPGPRPGQCPEAAGQQPPPPPRLEVPPAQKPELVLWPGHANARSPGRSSGHQRGCWTRSAERAVGMQTAHSAHASRPGAGPGQPRRALARPSQVGRHAGGLRGPQPRPGRSSLGAPILGEMSQPPSWGPLRPPGLRGKRAGAVSAVPSCRSLRSLVASGEGRARPPRGLPGTTRTRSLLFILLYLFSDLLTNWGVQGGAEVAVGPTSLSDPKSPSPWPRADLCHGPALPWGPGGPPAPWTPAVPGSWCGSSGGVGVIR